MLRELEELWRGFAADRECRAVILTGAGRGFCAGVDLSTVPEGADEVRGKPSRMVAGQKEWSAITPLLRQIPQPVIVAANGPAIGAGLAMVLGSDIRLASTSASFSAPFVKIGLSGGDMGVSWLLPRVVGAARAQEMMLTGRRIDATEAVRIGLVVDAVPDSELPDRAVEVAGSVAAQSPFGVRMTKELMWLSLEIGAMDTAIGLEVRTQALCTAGDDHWEAAAAFVEKRAPRFTDE